MAGKAPVRLGIVALALAVFVIGVSLSRIVGGTATTVTWVALVCFLVVAVVQIVLLVRNYRDSR
jgi:hypothetical protein